MINKEKIINTIKSVHYQYSQVDFTEDIIDALEKLFLLEDNINACNNSNCGFNIVNSIFNCNCSIKNKDNINKCEKFIH